MAGGGVPLEDGRGAVVVRSNLQMEEGPRQLAHVDRARLVAIEPLEDARDAILSLEGAQIGDEEGEFVPLLLAQGLEPPGDDLSC